jgi:hypothetical protein
MNDKLKRVLPSGISFVVIMLSILVTSSIQLYQSNHLAEQQRQIVDLKNRIDKISVENNTVVSKVKSQATGVDSERVKKDDEAVNNLMKKVFTWKTYKEYIDVRNDLMKTYSLSEDSEFMKTFMPNIENEVINGENYNQIDVNGYNITFNNVKSYVVSIDESSKVYEYFAIVNVTSKSNNGGSVDYDLALSYKMTSSQQIMNLIGYTLK